MFDLLTLDEIGAGGLAGEQRLVDEINDEIQALAKMVDDDRFGDAAAITVKIAIVKRGEHLVVVTGNVAAVKRPGRRRTAIGGMVTSDGLVTQQHRQEPLPLNVTPFAGTKPGGNTPPAN